MNITKKEQPTDTKFRLRDQQSKSEISPPEESVPAILTVRYNAWRYRNESEALVGMAVEITKEMEGIMTDAQWLSTCLRNAWRMQDQVICTEKIYQYLLAFLLGISFNWIVYLLLDIYNIKVSLELNIIYFPVTLVIMVWVMVKKVLNSLNPVSVQLMNYMKLPDHTVSQERVKSDISFLKEEIGRRPYFLCTVAFYVWRFITGSSIISLLFSKYHGETPSANLRTIVFVDDIDKCQESVILEVLSAINLVLSVCQISVVLGMDKALIQWALMKKYGDKSLQSSRHLADKYLQKVIQLPVDLPDPSKLQSKKFLDRQLGVFPKQTKEVYLESETDEEEDSIPEIDAAYNGLFSPLERLSRSEPNFGEMLVSMIRSPETRESAPETGIVDTEDTVVDVLPACETLVNAAPVQTLWQKTRKLVAGMQLINIFKTVHGQTNLVGEAPEEENIAEGDQSLNTIPIRQILFTTYGKGEQNVFDYFQAMATDIRKLPREWKRLLNYHRLVWNIFLINIEAKHLDGWQIQLITWIFICWEWEENMNIIIENWDRNRGLQEDKSSLRMIVDHFIKNESWIIVYDKGEKKRDTAKALEDSVNENTPPERLEGDKKGKAISMSTEDPEDVFHESLEGDKKGKTISVSKEDPEDVFNALKREMKEHVGSVTAEMKKQLDRNEKLLAELKEQVDSIVNQRQVLSNEKKKVKSESWGRLKFALQRYDVSMEGLQTFQRFRFYCVAGYLPWPVPPRRIADI